MNTGPVSTRYATALLNYSIENGQQDEVYQRMKLLVGVFFNVPELKTTLNDLSLPDKEKINIIITACGGNLPSSLEKVITLIANNEREGYMLFIAQRFIDLYRLRFKLQAGKLVTAVPVDKSTEDKLISRIMQITGSNVEIDTIVDPDIIGGFILRLDDNRWDASVKGELNRLQQSLVI